MATVNIRRNNNSMVHRNKCHTHPNQKWATALTEDMVNKWLQRLEVISM